LAVVNIAHASSRDISKERPWGCNINLPVPEIQTKGYAIDVLGWLLSRRLPAIAVEIVGEGSVLGLARVQTYMVTSNH
jgi:hypothetical protein